MLRHIKNTMVFLLITSFYISILFEHYCRIIISLSHILSFREINCHWSSCVLLCWMVQQYHIFISLLCMFVQDQFLCHSQDITFKKSSGNVRAIHLVFLIKAVESIAVSKSHSQNKPDFYEDGCYFQPPP